MRTYIHTFKTYTRYIRAYIHTYIHIYTYTYIHIHTYTHIHTYIHTWAKMYWWLTIMFAIKCLLCPQICIRLILKNKPFCMEKPWILFTCLTSLPPFPPPTQHLFLPTVHLGEFHGSTYLLGPSLPAINSHTNNQDNSNQYHKNANWNNDENQILNICCVITTLAGRTELLFCFKVRLHINVNNESSWQVSVWCFPLLWYGLFNNIPLTSEQGFSLSILHIIFLNLSWSTQTVFHPQFLVSESQDSSHSQVVSPKRNLSVSPQC